MTGVSTSSLLIDPPSGKHIALLYENSDKLNPFIALYINEGLRRGQLCVYATIHYRDEGYFEKFANLVNNYKENIEKGNLIVVDLAPFYISALMGNMTPFEEARKMFIEKAKTMVDRHVRFVGDGTEFLFKHKHFDECAMVEGWWQEKPFEGSYVCPYEKQIFEAFHHEMHSTHAVLHTHDVLIDAYDETLHEISDNTVSDQLQQQSDLNQRVQGYNNNETRIESEGELN